jgi:uncharacterized protein DUF748
VKHRKLLITGIVLVAVLVVIRVLLDPIATYYTRKTLHDADGIDGDVGHVHISLFPPGYDVHVVKVIQIPGGNWKEPLFFAERAKVRVDWRELLHGRVSASLRVDDPKIIVEKVAPSPKEAAEKKKTEIPDVRAALEQIMPARVSRIEIRNGEFLFQDLTEPRHPEFWIHDLEVAVENLATRTKLAHGEPATVSGSAKLGRSGDITMFVSAAPFTKTLDVAGNVALRGWKLAELYDIEEPAAGLQTPKGTLDVFIEFKIRNNYISGGVKPVLKNVEVKPTKSTIGNRLKAWLADTALHLFSDRVPDRNAVATVVPIEGRLDDPKIEIWPTVLGVVRNAFVQGVSSGFTHLPPPTTDEKQGPVKQAVNALKKDKGPPKAQPIASKSK